VPIDTYRRHHGGSKQLSFHHPSQGGHMGYWTAGKRDFWAAGAALDGIESMLDKR
jgi:predicted alpha/beta-fold hydrolase